MIRIVARFLISSMTPNNLITLGELLIAAGKAVEARHARTQAAVQSVKTAVSALTEK